MIKIQIKTALGEVLFEYEKENNTLKKTLEKAVNKESDLRGADLTGADLRGADLTGAYLRGAYLTGAYLRGADLTGAYLRGAYLRGAYLTRAYLRGADLRGADLTGAYLRGAYLRGADLRGADLTGAYLRGAYLTGAYLRGADLTGAYLRGADLTRADLTEADLTEADLTEADLTEADLTGAYLTEADLEPIKRDMFDVLLRAIPEIKNLKKAIKKGKIDGSTYEGDCACLAGTLLKCKIPEIKNRITRDSSRPIERFFLAIKPGDTPENKEASKLALEWIEEFESYLKPVQVTGHDVEQELQDMAEYAFPELKTENQVKSQMLKQIEKAHELIEKNTMREIFEARDLLERILIENNYYDRS